MFDSHADHFYKFVGSHDNGLTKYESISFIISLLFYILSKWKIIRHFKCHIRIYSYERS